MWLPYDWHICYIREHISEPLTVADVASVIGYSRSHLSHAYKKETGEPVYDFIQQEKLNKAKQLLSSSSFPAAEIWRDLRFCSQSHFTTFFKKLIGQTPTQFRQCARAAELSEMTVAEQEDTTTPYVAFSDTTDSFDAHREALKNLYDYAEDIGFKQEMHFLYCVKKGRVQESEAELSDPRFARTMGALFQAERTLAYETFRFLLPQIQGAAVDGGVNMKVASQMYEKFSERARTADVPELLKLNREAFIAFTACVAADGT